MKEGGTTMGQIKETTQRAKLFFALLASSTDVLDKTVKRLAMDFSPVETISPVVPFTHTTYYEKEMGQNLLRQWIGMTLPIFVTEVPALKRYANRLEEIFAENRQRRVNIDPGYVMLSKVVLATTKDYDHRLYIGNGIFAEVTLHYRRQGGWEAWPWTYPDYRTDHAMKFFSDVRSRLGVESSL